MIFLFVLALAYALTWLVPPRARWNQKARWRVALALAMAFAGMSHLLMPAPFLQHVPPWVPAPDAVVLLSGLIEVAFGVALLAPWALRSQAGLALAAYLIAVFPGNIYVAVADVDVQGQPDGIYPWLRLLLQPLFVWLAVWSTRSALQPSRRRSTAAHAAFTETESVAGPTPASTSTRPM